MGTDILDIIRRAYRIEVDGRTFYSMAAERAQKPSVRQLFERLAQDERQHQEYLREVASSYKSKGAAVFAVKAHVPDWSDFSGPVFTARIREEAQGAEFETGVLSVGMGIESNSIAHYSAAARSSEDEKGRTFYQFLTVWERQHLVALQNAYKAVRSDFWEKSGL
jgi:rubrerythrin